MVLFDDIREGSNSFVRHDPVFLKQLFGTEDVTPFWVADMDFAVAEPITNELKRLVDRAVYAYEFDSKSVYRAISDWNSVRHGLDLDPKNFLQVPGVLTGIALLIRILTKPGDGVLVQTPVYHQFAKVITTAGREMVANPLRQKDGHYEMDFEDLEARLQSQSVKMILICNPHNPVGRVWRKEELQQLLELANQYDVAVVSDEIHSDIVYSGNRFSSLLSLGETSIALLGSPAKTFGMQSIASGYLYIENEALKQQVGDMIDSMYLGHGNALSTFATIAAYRHGADWVDQLLAYLEKTIDWIEQFLKDELPIVQMSPVEGTYQIWMDFGKTGLSSQALNHFLANKAKIGLAPGSWFGKEGDSYMRMNIASPLSKIQNAFYQIKQACQEEGVL